MCRSFSHGLFALRITESVLVGREGRGFPFQADCDPHHSRQNNMRHSIRRMDAQRMRRFKTLLVIRQHELRLRIKDNQQYARGAEPEPDIVDQAASESEKGSLFKRSDREYQLLRAIDSALDRIRAGSYGKCLSCTKDIDERRLAAIPWTPYCIQCEEASETVTR